MKRVLIVFGTRPEAIKMAPVVHALRQHPDQFEVIVCVTGQHREMLDQVLNVFSLRPDHDLAVMESDQSLARLTTKVMTGLDTVIDATRPDLVMVHGDTTTTLAASLAAFYRQVPVAHVEAGLRSGDIRRPWPEEMNRRATSLWSSFHFAPTPGAAENLKAEGVHQDRVWITGNTVIDALDLARERLQRHPEDLEAVRSTFPFLDPHRKLILVTGHRRENFGPGIDALCHALQHLAKRADVQIVYPVHLNRHVAGPVTAMLGDAARIHLVQPLQYLAFVYLMERAHLIITDSGGIQEEAPHLGTPVLVTRQVTERPEAVSSGVARLVGTRADDIIREATRLLDEPEAHEAMRSASNPFGDGRAAERIVDALRTALVGPPDRPMLAPAFVPKQGS